MTLGDPAAGAAGRTATAAGRLARLGFADVPRRRARPARTPAWPALADADDRLLAALSCGRRPRRSPSAALVRLLDAAARRQRAALRRRAAPTRRRACSTGSSPSSGRASALGDHLARHPDHWERAGARPRTRRRRPPRRARELLVAVGASPDAAEPVAALDGTAGSTRCGVAYRRRLLVARRPRPDRARRRSSRPRRRWPTSPARRSRRRSRSPAPSCPAGAEPCRLAVIAMGKCGGRELNYVSDVDVVFVAEPVDGRRRAGGAGRRRPGSRPALMRVCSAPTAEGDDLAGRRRACGPRAGTARSCAPSPRTSPTTSAGRRPGSSRRCSRRGRSPATSRSARRTSTPCCRWCGAPPQRPNFVEDVQAMRRRVEEHVPAKEAERQLKLGRGGLRDVEFAVQLLQLVHGRADVFVRSPSTLVALEPLSTHGYVGRDDAAELDRAYRFLRTLEHRLQLHRLRRTHVVPDDDAELRRLARSMGFRSDPVDELTGGVAPAPPRGPPAAREALLPPAAQRRRAARRRTRRGSAPRRPATGSRRSATPTRRRAAPPRGADRRGEPAGGDPAHAAAGDARLVRRAPDPDAGLLGFRQVSDALGSTPWYLRLLRDEGAAAERLARVLASSRYASDLLLRAPEAVRAARRRRRAAAAAARRRSSTEMLAAAGRQDDPTAAIAAVRAVRRRELFRIAVADLLGLLDVDGVGDALTDVAAATVARRAGGSRTRGRGRSGGARCRRALLVVAMGRFGGHELGYGSDADVLFVHDPLEGADEREAHDAAHAVADELRRLLALPGAGPAAARRRRPATGGPAGPARPHARVVRRVLRALVAGVGEPGAAARRAGRRATPSWPGASGALIDPLRWPEGGLTDDRRPRDPPDQGAGRGRAAAARRRSPEKGQSHCH